MNKGLVSIIIPVYNKQIYIEDCLNSLFCQTWNNIEIIAINDGSTDKSWGILSILAEKDSRVTLLQIPHSGPSIARNIGMLNATGEYITFIDADDYVEPSYIENLVLNIRDADLCISGYKNWAQRKDLWEKIRCCSAILNKEELYLHLKQLKTIEGIGWKLYKRTFLIDHNVFFSDSLDYGEDLLFIHYVLIFVRKAVCIDNMEYVVREHDLYSLTHLKNSIEKNEILLNALHGLLDNSHPILSSFIKNEEYNLLGNIGKKLCYQNIDMCTRKKIIFDIAKKHQIYSDSSLGFPKTKAGMAIRFSLMTRTFLPFFFLIKLWHHFKEEER